MRKLIILLWSILYCLPSVYAQTYNHRWDPLTINDSVKIWYDASQLDSVKDNKADIWILQMYRPPLIFSEIPKKIYRSQTLYAINLNTVKYGIMKVSYYGLTDNLLYSFDYNINNLPEELKYTYPIFDHSFLHELIKKILKYERNHSNSDE